VGSEEKTNTYEETVSRTTSEPAAEATATDEAAITTAPAGDIETYEVQSVTTPEEESVSTKAREAGRSLKELMSSLSKKTREVTEEKARELKAQSVDISVKTDARDIQHLGDDVEKLITVFEDTMTEIRKGPYDEQEKLLVGYKKLLEEQINVINARLSMAKRLKPGA
jgi:arginine utilization protein RocB